MTRLRFQIILASCTLGVGALLATASLNQVADNKQRASKTRKVAGPQPAAPPAQQQEPQPLGVAQPGSPEAQRIADLRARVREGRVRIAYFEQAPQPDLSRGSQMPEFVATQIVPQKDAKGEMLAFQSKLSPLFAATGPLPASRLNHFAWLKAHPNVRIFGWYGTVTAAELQPDSSVLVDVEFHPQTEIKGMRGVVLDHLTERYRVANGALHLINSDAALMNPAIQRIQSL